MVELNFVSNKDLSSTTDTGADTPSSSSSSIVNVPLVNNISSSGKCVDVPVLSDVENKKSSSTVKSKFVFKNVVKIFRSFL